MFNAAKPSGYLSLLPGIRAVHKALHNSLDEAFIRITEQEVKGIGP